MGYGYAQDADWSIFFIILLLILLFIPMFGFGFANKTLA